jgi:hypothetical protein
LVHSKSNPEDQGFAQALVLELLAPGIDEPALGAGWSVVGNLIPLHPPIPERRKLVARRPDAGGELLAEKIAPTGEALEGDIAVPVVFVAHGIEIMLATGDRETRSPPVLDPVVFDVAARLEASDPIWSTAERHLERRLVEGAARVVGTGKNRAAGHEQRDVTCPVGREAHHDREVVGCLGSGEIAQQLLGDRMALVLENLQRERHVGRGQRAAVMKLES